MSNGDDVSGDGDTGHGHSTGHSKPGARYTEAEWQQMVLGLKRENKDNLEKLRKEQDEALFKVYFINLLYLQGVQKPSFILWVLNLALNFPFHFSKKKNLIIPIILYFLLFYTCLSDCQEPSFDKMQCKWVKNALIITQNLVE